MKIYKIILLMFISFNSFGQTYKSHCYNTSEQEELNCDIENIFVLNDNLFTQRIDGKLLMGRIKYYSLQEDQGYFTYIYKWYYNSEEHFVLISEIDDITLLTIIDTKGVNYFFTCVKISEE